MKLEIVRRQITKIGNDWFEVEELKRQGKTIERSWSSFAVFVPGHPDTLRLTLKAQLSSLPHIDISATPDGVWLLASHFDLAKAIPMIGHEIGQLHPAR